MNPHRRYRKIRRLLPAAVATVVVVAGIAIGKHLLK